VAKLCDLGTTKSTSSFRRHEGLLATSLYYRAPEVEVSTKSDVYSLAVMLAEVVLQHLEVEVRPGWVKGKGALPLLSLSKQLE
jgi:serine/threonine protein kinase